VQLQLIRNALIKLTYAGQTILLDPDLAEQHSRPSFTGRSPNPTVALPLPIAEIVADLDLIIVSHLHKDHFDAVDALPRDLVVLCQPENQAAIAQLGFNAQALDKQIVWNGIEIIRTTGSHGLGEVAGLMGSVSGFVLRAQNQPTIYWVGDSVLYDAVEQVLAQYQPDIVITHSCGARWPDSSQQRQLIVMDAEQTLAVCQAVPQAIVVATHMEAVDHATVTRAALRSAAELAQIGPDRLLIPHDGEILELNKT
jgi:L-ascorbate metabolism protein UlaG (beta-lactamase superfamily)